MSHSPSVDESWDRLHRAGWSLGEYAVGPEHGLVWCVEGQNGANRIEARGQSQAEAWWRACQSARALGVLAPPAGEARE